MGGQKWKEYFQFSKKERTGIVALLLMLLGVLVFPHITDRWQSDPARPLSLDDQLVIQKMPKPSKDEREEGAAPLYRNKYYPSREEGSANPSPQFFIFNPNTATETDWKKLGLKDKTIQTIQRYLSKGGKFRSASDLRKVYGLSPSLAEKLEPFVSIPPPVYAKGSRSDSGAFVSTFTKNKEKAPRSIQALEINTADSLEWVALPGIGPSLTHRILNFREKLGGFYDISQVAEVYALPDSTFQAIKPLLKCNNPKIKKLPLNSISEAELEQHPYFRKKLARVLIAYRDQHGPFRSLEDLNRVFLISPDQLTKLLPYLSVGE